MKIQMAKFNSPVNIPVSGGGTMPAYFDDRTNGVTCTASDGFDLRITGPLGTVFVPSSNVAFLIPFPTETVKQSKK